MDNPNLKLKLSSFAEFDKIEDQIKKQRTLKDKTDKKPGAFTRIMNQIVLGAFFLSVGITILILLAFLFRKTESVDYISEFIVYKACKNILLATYVAGFVSLTGLLSYGAAASIQKIYTVDLNYWTILMKCLCLIGGAVGLSVGIMQVLGFVFRIDYGDSYEAVGIFASLSIFLITSIVEFVINKDIYLASTKDIDKGELRIKGSGDIEDVKIDLLENEEKVINLAGDEDISDAHKERYRKKARDLIIGKNNITKGFVCAITVWAIIVISPLAIPMALYLPSTIQMDRLHQIMEDLIQFMNKSTLPMKFGLLVLLGLVNWIFSVFIHFVSFLTGAVLGELRTNSSMIKENLSKKIALSYKEIILNQFNRTFIMSSTNIILSVWYFPFELFKEPTSNILDHRTVTKKALPLASLVMSLSSMLFSGIFSLFSAFKQINLGMYTVEQIKKGDIASFDKNWESYLGTCIGIFCIIMGALILMGMIFAFWYDYDINGLREFYTRIITKMDIFTFRTWILLAYMVLMILFVVMPTTFEIIYGRSRLTKDLVIDKVLTRANIA